MRHPQCEMPHGAEGVPARPQLPGAAQASSCAVRAPHLSIIVWFALTARIPLPQHPNGEDACAPPLPRCAPVSGPCMHAWMDACRRHALHLHAPAVRLCGGGLLRLV